MSSEQQDDEDMWDADFYDDEPPTCPYCDAEMQWDDCPDCAGEGTIEHEPDNEEPWYSLEGCTTCHGGGGGLVCSQVAMPAHVDAVMRFRADLKAAYEAERGQNPAREGTD